ncbi:MAG: hypothetical protein U9R16_00740, partial [Campylobacterota bacterium]|nr:hypothetical protein [Campylobacterota bacterium]
LLGLTKGKSRVGVKFRGISPDLFISYKLFDDYPLKYQFNFHIENKIMYFVDYKLDNTLQMNFSKMVNDSMRFSFNNSYRFQEEFNDRHKVIHSLNLLNNLDYKSYINYSLSSYSTNDNTKSFGVDYYYAGTSYKNFYYKNWAYYKIDTGLTFRKDNNFDAKARAMIKLGILFGKSKSKFNIKDN